MSEWQGIGTTVWIYNTNDARLLYKRFTEEKKAHVDDITKWHASAQKADVIP